MIQLAIDLDGVCYNFEASLRKLLMEKTGRPASDFPPANTWWYFVDQWGITIEEYYKWTRMGIEEKQVFWRGPQIEDALWGVSELYKMGYYIKFITARGGDNSEINEQCKQATLYWLNSNGFPYDEVIMSHNKTSLEWDLLIDDSPSNYEACIKDERNMLVFDLLLNRHLTDAPRAKNWIEVVEYVKTHFPLQMSVREVV